MSNKVKIKVFLTDEHKVMRDGLRTLLYNHPRITVVGEADNFTLTKQLVHT